jgi:hypothetical protein
MSMGKPGRQAPSLTVFVRRQVEPERETPARGRREGAMVTVNGPDAMQEMRERWRRRLIAFQAAYYLATGLWPLVHLPSFEAVTGPKTDDWLVHMVGLLAAVVVPRSVWQLPTIARVHPRSWYWRQGSLLPLRDRFLVRPERHDLSDLSGRRLARVESAIRSDVDTPHRVALGIISSSVCQNRRSDLQLAPERGRSTGLILARAFFQSL